MKLVKNVVFAVVLVSTFAVNTPAGDMPSPGSAAPTPPETPKVVYAPTDDTSKPQSDETKGQITDETLDFLLSEALRALVFSVF